MSKLEGKYVPIGSVVEEEKPNNQGKSLKQLEEEAKLSGGPRANKKKDSKPGKNKLTGQMKPIGSDGTEVKPLVSIKEEKVESLVNIEDETIEPLIEINAPEEKPLEDDLFDDSFLNDLAQVEEAVKHEIEVGNIKLIVTNADQNMQNIKELFDDAVIQIVSNVDYEVKHEQQVEYAKELKAVSNKLERLEQTIDYENYHNELRVSEVEGSMLRESRYRKRKFEGLDEIGGISGADHRTSEKQEDIGLRKYTESDQGFGTEKNNIPQRERKRETDYVERRAFVQDYEGSDLEGIDKERDRLEQEILRKQEAEEKNSKRKSKKKTEEEKIAEAKERLRKKQEKRKAKQQKRAGAEEIDEIDLVGNQFDIDELREERMDRLLEIKRISAEKKEMQKQKEKQRSKATKEFYKYKKVNKKSHIVGFKQQ